MMTKKSFLLLLIAAFVSWLSVASYASYPNPFNQYFPNPFNGKNATIANDLSPPACFGMMIDEKAESNMSAEMNPFNSMTKDNVSAMNRQSRIITDLTEISIGMCPSEINSNAAQANEVTASTAVVNENNFTNVEKKWTSLFESTVNNDETANVRTQVNDKTVISATGDITLLIESAASPYMMGDKESVGLPPDIVASLEDENLAKKKTTKNFPNPFNRVNDVDNGVLIGG